MSYTRTTIEPVTNKYGILAGGLAAVALVGATVMAIAGVPIATIATIMGLTVGPVLGWSMAQGIGELKAQNATTAAQVASVAVQTNGNTSRMLDMIQDAHRALAAAHVPTDALPPAAQPTPVPAPPVAGTGASSSDPAGPPSATEPAEPVSADHPATTTAQAAYEAFGGLAA